MDILRKKQESEEVFLNVYILKKQSSIDYL